MTSVAQILSLSLIAASMAVLLAAGGLAGPLGAAQAAVFVGALVGINVVHYRAVRGGRRSPAESTQENR